jgi:hypothetical protein
MQSEKMSSMNSVEDDSDEEEDLPEPPPLPTKPPPFDDDKKSGKNKNLKLTKQFVTLFLMS